MSRVAIGSRAPLCLLFFVVSMVYAEQQGVLDPESLPWLTWGWVVGLSVGAWFASCAPTLVNWVDGDGISRTRNRLMILARLVVSLLAGGAAFFLATFGGANKLLAFLAVIGASYGGDKYLLAMSERVLPQAKTDADGRLP